MPKKRLRLKTLSFTVLSSDLSKGITRFRLPRFIIPVLGLLFIIPIVLFAYYYYSSKQLTKENERLANELNEKTTEVNELVTEVVHMKETESEVRTHLEILYELESQVKESMKDLPIDVETDTEASGGIDIELSESEAMRLQEDTSNLTHLSARLIDRYENTKKTLDKTNKELLYIPTEWPVEPNKITSKFGVRTDPFRRTSSLHTGIDIRGNLGDPVYATANGEVIQAEYSGGHGNLIIIRHSEKHNTWYAHLSKMNVSSGDKVKKGETIGLVGSTGRSTGPHLHYEIIEHGKPIDPYTYLSIYDHYEEGK